MFSQSDWKISLWNFKTIFFWEYLEESLISLMWPWSLWMHLRSWAIDKKIFNPGRTCFQVSFSKAVVMLSCSWFQWIQWWNVSWFAKPLFLLKLSQSAVPGFVPCALFWLLRLWLQLTFFLFSTFGLHLPTKTNVRFFLFFFYEPFPKNPIFSFKKHALIIPA